MGGSDSGVLRGAVQLKFAVPNFTLLVKKRPAKAGRLSPSSKSFVFADGFFCVKKYRYHDIFYKSGE